MKKEIHIGVFIDGTGNYRENDETIGNGTQSNVAKLDKLFNDNPDNIQSIYVPGVGTHSFEELGFTPKDPRIQEIRDGKVDINHYYDFLPLTTGLALDDKDRGVEWQVEYALKNIEKRVKDIEINHPDTDIKIDIIGFSRGATSSRDLVNTLHEQGIINENTHVNFIGLYDTVSSVGLANGNNGEINVDLDNTSATNIVHYVAKDECRSNFRSELFNGTLNNVEEILKDGAHADIGGAYGIRDLKEYYIKEGSDKSIKVHNSDIPTKMHELQMDAKEKGYGLHYEIISHKQDNHSTINSAYVETKEIGFGLSNVTLQDMYHKMQDNGIKLAPLEDLGNVKNDSHYSNWEVPKAIQENPHVISNYVHASHIDNNRVYPLGDNYLHASTSDMLANAPEANHERSKDINEPTNAKHDKTVEESIETIDEGYEFQSDSTTTKHIEKVFSIELADQTQELDTTQKAQEVANTVYTPSLDQDQNYAGRTLADDYGGMDID